MKSVAEFTRDERSELLDDIARAFDMRGTIRVRFVKRAAGFYWVVIDDEYAGRHRDDAVRVGTVRSDGGRWRSSYESWIGVATASVDGRRSAAADGLVWAIAHDHAHRTHFLAAGTSP